MVYELKSKLNAGNLADFTHELRAAKPANWDGDVRLLPDAELALVAVKAGRKAHFFDGPGPTDAQAREMDFDVLLPLATAIFNLYAEWNNRATVTDEEKNG